MQLVGGVVDHDYIAKYYMVLGLGNVKLEQTMDVYSYALREIEEKAAKSLATRLVGESVDGCKSIARSGLGFARSWLVE